MPPPLSVRLRHCVYWRIHELTHCQGLLLNRPAARRSTRSRGGRGREETRTGFYAHAQANTWHRRKRTGQNPRKLQTRADTIDVMTQSRSWRFSQEQPQSKCERTLNVCVYFCPWRSINLLNVKDTILLTHWNVKLLYVQGWIELDLNQRRYQVGRYAERQFSIWLKRKWNSTLL